MAWAVHTQVHDADEIAGAIDNTEPQSHVSKAQLDQMRAAKAAAKQLIADGVVGDKDSNYLVALDGHVGEGSTESVSIRIQVVPVPVPADMPPPPNVIPPDQVERDRKDV